MDAPVDGREFPYGTTSVRLNWSGPSYWGVECAPNQARQTRVCVGTNSTNPCTGGTAANIDRPTTLYNYAQSTPGTYYWRVRAINRDGTLGPWSQIRSFIINDVGTIRARAVVVDPSNTSCATIRGGGTGGIDGTIFSFTPSSASQPPPQTQSGNTAVTFNNVVTGSYTIVAQVPSQYVIERYCWRKNPSVTFGEDSSTTLAGGETLIWSLGYTLADPWSQIEGGDVYASGVLKSIVPASATPRVFITDGTGGYPGIATYGTSYDFDAGLGKGASFVSSTNWLVQDTASKTISYQTMYDRFGGEPAAVDYVNPGSITQPAYKADMNTPYYVTGNMTTSGNWGITNGKKLIFLIDGDLTIGGRIITGGTGIAVFIVSGSITVDSSVGRAFGTAWTSTPVVEGVYIADGTFDTGTSGVGTERFVGGGIFIANDFILGRDMTDNNPTTSSELFIYEPQFLLTMPNQMKQSSVSWQEVAP